MESKQEYKQTAIGMIPKEWEVVRLGDEAISEIRGNKTVNHFERVAFIPMEFVPESNILVNYEIRPMNEVKSFTYCESGDLLLSKITPSLENGKQGIVPDDIPKGFALATTEVFPISCRGIDKFFLFYLLKYSKYRNKIISSMIGTTGRQRASKESVKNLFIPLPPLPEQKKIAEVLSTVDSAIQKVDEAIMSTQRLKKGLMQELLTKGIGHKEFKNTEIGRIPKEWEVVKLSQVGNIITGTTPSTDRDEFWGEGYPFVTPTDFSDSKYVFKTERSVTRSGAEQGRLIPKNSVMVVCIASVGEVAISSMECITNQQINTIVCNKDVNPHFIYYGMIFSKNILKRWAGITTSPIIKKSSFENFLIPLPSLSEQQKISEILTGVDEKLGLLNKRKERFVNLKKGLMNELLTGKKRVRL